MFEVMVTSSILIVALILLRYLLRNKISRRLQYALWLLVALRLLAPVTVFQNPFNVLNVLQAVADGEKYAEQGAGGNRRVVYRMESADGNRSVAHNGQQDDGRVKNRPVDGSLMAVKIIGQQEQGINAFLDSQGTTENQGIPEDRKFKENQKSAENRGDTGEVPVFGNPLGQRRISSA